jgi:hypothetical protein
LFLVKLILRFFAGDSVAQKAEEAGQKVQGGIDSAKETGQNISGFTNYFRKPYCGPQRNRNLGLAKNPQKCG